jgi:tellurite resistance protein TerC
VGWVRPPRESGLYAYTRKIVIGVVGTTVVLLGLAMLVLPGPAVLVIPFGVAILGAEFAWARQLQRRVKDEAARMAAESRARTIRKRWASPRP